ncbi:hypothetical protein D3C71_2014620 [compost metagenome]
MFLQKSFVDYMIGPITAKPVKFMNENAGEILCLFLSSSYHFLKLRSVISLGRLCLIEIFPDYNPILF